MSLISEESIALGFLKSSGRLLIHDSIKVRIIKYLKGVLTPLKKPLTANREREQKNLYTFKNKTGGHSQAVIAQSELIFFLIEHSELQ